MPFRRKKPPEPPAQPEPKSSFSCPTCGSDNFREIGEGNYGSIKLKCQHCGQIFFRSKPVVMSPIDTDKVISLGDLRCPSCGSTKIEGGRYGDRFRCKSCNRHFS